MSEASPLSRKTNEKGRKSGKLESIHPKREKSDSSKNANDDESGELGPVEKANVSSSPKKIEQERMDADSGYEWEYEKALEMAKECRLLAGLADEMSKVFCKVFAEHSKEIDGPQKYFEKFDDNFLGKVREFSNDLVSTYGLDFLTIFLSYIQAKEAYRKLFEHLEDSLGTIQFFTGMIDLFDVSNKHFVLMEIVIDNLLVLDEDSVFYTDSLVLFEELLVRYCASNNFPYKKNPINFLFNMLPYKSVDALNSVARSVWKKQNIFDFLKTTIEKVISSPPKHFSPYPTFVVAVIQFLVQSQNVKRLHHAPFSAQNLVTHPEGDQILDRLRKRVSMSGSPPGREPEKPAETDISDAGGENQNDSVTENLTVLQPQDEEANDQIDEVSEVQPKEAPPPIVHEETIESSSSNRDKIKNRSASEIEVLKSISEELSIVLASLSEQTITSVHNQTSSLIQVIEERVFALHEQNAGKQRTTPSVSVQVPISTTSGAVSEVSSVEDDEEFPPIRDASLQTPSDSNRATVMRTSAEKAEGRSDKRRQVSPYEGYRFRRKWTEEQERELFDMIEQYGCSWSKIVYMQRIDKRPLHDFAPTHIKDKARLIKARYMKQNRLQNLYQHSPNWKYVTVGPAYCEIHKIPYTKEASITQ
ncbi:TRF Taz1 [Schizosaccharomyces cryophilus OY26]|uniref:TRF Taz1 n=1 Tax=Schizosaccharomyces cryophilus (strain OY26 / ATCC MYA-4695 / CBS 11777 / NBRC 106824 / NRRL Y48691) TaxID=653667 RepID=S9XI76_SCHCR|nr:TRF Taz1 [Schizosaccharomyces cryophilus OY26]EPY53351.1 TRF Taz1 [Schizosaccharomyces cryophilus OY26]